ncbi:MAG: hypothetical protein GY838_11840 [bacterium]|nr:hypothetical protein [bacterium]
MSERDARGLRARLPWLILAAVVILLVAASVAAAEAKDRGEAAEEDWAPVTLLYMTDVKGKIEPCG